MKPGTPVLRSTRLLDQLQEQIRYLHYSLNTEKAYLDWVRFFVRWHGRNGEMRHGAGTVGAQRRVHHHDLHACAEGCRRRHSQPIEFIGLWRLTGD